jgi:hypothetical protein
VLVLTHTRSGPIDVCMHACLFIHYTNTHAAWLRAACSSRMTAVLLAPGGLRAVMEAFLGGLPQQEESLQVRDKDQPRGEGK